MELTGWIAPLIIAGAAVAAVCTAIAVWLWRTPLSIGGRLAGGLERALDVEGEVRFHPFWIRAVPSEGQVILSAGFHSRTLWSGPLPRQRESPPIAEQIDEAGRNLKKSADILGFLDRHWGLGNIALLLLSLRRFIRTGKLEGYLEYGTEDPAITGRLFGYQCSVAYLLPELPDFRVVPVWKFRTWFEIDTRLLADFHVARMAVAILWFGITRFRLKPPARPQPESAPSIAGIEHPHAA